MMKFNDRKMLVEVLLLGAIFATSSCFSCKGVHQQGSNPPTVDFCYLVRNPGIHNQPIRTRAILHRDPENVALYDPNCDDKTTYTWAEYDESLVSSSEDRKKLEKALCQSSPCRTGEARVTVVGQLSGPYENGYGHLNDYRFRFSIVRVEQAEALKESTR